MAKTKEAPALGFKANWYDSPPTPATRRRRGINIHVFRMNTAAEQWGWHVTHPQMPSGLCGADGPGTQTRADAEASARAYAADIHLWGLTK